MSSNKVYWKGIEQLQETPEFLERANKEFPEYLPLAGEDGEPSRRDFLKMMGFGIAAVSLAACETPIKKAIPYVKKPVDVDPTIPNYYATTYISGGDAASIVVKTREGRPIKIDGNKFSTVTGGGTTPQIEASVLTLYDKERLQSPLINGEKASWEEIDAAVVKDLAASSGKVYLISHSINSPSTLEAINTLIAKYPNVEVVQYDPISSAAILDANQSAFGVRVLPKHHFDKANTIVSIFDDFLGDHPSRAFNNKKFAASRKLGKGKTSMSRLYAFESNLSLTGANADYRVAVKASESGLWVAGLYNLIAQKAGGSTLSVGLSGDATLVKAANELWKNRGASIVTCGINDIDVQNLVVAINQMLDSYGKTISIANGFLTRKGNDKAMATAINALSSGKAAGVIFYNCNPVYDHALGQQLGAAINSLKFSLATNDRKDESSSLVKYNAPDHHLLESWNDAEIALGKFSVSQPTISNIFNTRQAQDSFLIWADSTINFYDSIRNYWKTTHYPAANKLFFDFDSFWDQVLHDGVYELADASSEPSFNDVLSSDISRQLSAKYKESNGIDLVLYAKSAIGNGYQANNPWLQEMPDPISKACWDNYLTVAPSQLEEWGVKLGDMTTQIAKLTVGDVSIEVPVLPQPGQQYNTVGLAFGYGRTIAGKVANGVGVSAYPLIASASGYNSHLLSDVKIEIISNSTYRLAQTQTTHTYMGRETIIQESILSKYKDDPQAGRFFPKIATSEGYKKPYAVSLWKGHEYANHHWGLVVDLNSCTGCGACTVACQVENNVPVVGKDEVLNRREMHWIRIDRYYSFDQSAVNAASGPIAKNKAMEQAAANPEVVFQPMMCQHCNNAPCETVCPVAATTHSTEGLNQMTYNRCIGTRYCANNCPYKVRRFNWFKYHDNSQFKDNLAMNSDLGKMVLNPDVTVRSRGVIEKCSFCVQRIQAGKLEAKKAGRRPIDGEIVSACAAACPSEALVFGDMKDPESAISKLLDIKSSDKGVEAKEPRAYHVLEELRVMPNVWYLTKIRNKDEEKTMA